MDFRSDILSRAEIVGIELSSQELERFNDRVNLNVSNGSHQFDALDMVYFSLQNLKEQKEAENKCPKCGYKYVADIGFGNLQCMENYCGYVFKK